MKRLILSAFALSLTLIPWVGYTQTEAIDDFLGLETEVMPDLEGPQRFTPPELHEKNDWKVDEKEVVMDKEPLKGQGHSIIPWKDISPENFLNIEHWISDRNLKDVTPDWKIRLRDQRHLELIGKVLKCVGVCPVYRGVEKANVEHLSRIVEGDEFHTEKDSYAWVYLMDGSLIRIGAESSVSFHEILISSKEIFYLLRLNHGHVYWHPRYAEAEPKEFRPETDTIFLPLMLREANMEWYERKRFGMQNDREHLDEVMELRDLAIADQLSKLNELKTRNNETIEKSKQKELVTKVMVVAPNVTVSTTKSSFNFIHVPGGKSWFKRSRGEADLVVETRGYSVNASKWDDPDNWTEVESNGRSISRNVLLGELSVAELLSKRISTIEFAREVWLKKFGLPVITSIDDQKKLAVDHGYRFWNETSLNKRQEFLWEYTRRMETSHLRSVENLMQKLAASGEEKRPALTNALYQKALNHYLFGLKKLYTQKRMRIREMNELEYYVWLLKNGKI